MSSRTPSPAADSRGRTAWHRSLPLVYREPSGADSWLTAVPNCRPSAGWSLVRFDLFADAKAVTETELELF